jgi:hypothetical protein
VEFFEAEEIDVSTNAQGRNKLVILGQFGIRCRHWPFCLQDAAREDQRTLQLQLSPDMLELSKMPME